MYNKTEENVNISISDIIGFSKKFWYIILITIVVFSGGGVLLTKLQTPVYSSESNFYITTSSSDEGSLSIDKEITISGAITPFISDCIVSKSALEKIYDRYLKEKYPDLTVIQLKEMVTSSIKSFSSQSSATNYNRQFKIVVESNDPVLCQDILIAYVQSFSSDDNIIDGIDHFNIKCSSGFPEVGSQISPSLFKNVAVSVVIGIMISLIILFIMYFTNTTIVTSEDLASRFPSIPVLAVIPGVSSCEGNGDSDKSDKIESDKKNDERSKENVEK